MSKKQKSFKQFFNEGIRATSGGIPGWKYTKDNGLDVCYSCVRPKPCGNCPNIIPTMAVELGMHIVTDDETDYVTAYKNGHAIFVKDGMLWYEYVPSGDRLNTKVSNWLQWTQDLAKVVNGEESPF